MSISTRAGLAFLAFGAIAVFLLTTEHRAHLFGALPYLLLFSCLFLHRFLHGGHSQHGAAGTPGESAGHSHRGTREEGV
jgi:hypothetical protein